MRIVYSMMTVTTCLSNRRWPATVIWGRAKLGRPWGSFFLTLLVFYFGYTCTTSDVSEAVQNRVRFRPWGGAHSETISRSVAETRIDRGS